MKRLKSGLLKEPVRPNNVSKFAKWLTGIGAGSWFEITIKEEKVMQYQVSRYNEQGTLEFKKLFEQKGVSTFKWENSYELCYPSHALEINIIQNGTNIKLTPMLPHNPQ